MVSLDNCISVFAVYKLNERVYKAEIIKPFLHEDHQ